MQDGYYGSMVEPRVQNPELAQMTPEPKKGHKKLLIIIIAALVLITGVVAVVVLLLPNDDVLQESGVDNDDSGDYADMILTHDASIGTAFANALDNGAGSKVKRSKCNQLISLGNQYIKKYGGNAISDAVCSGSEIKAGLISKTLDESPYPDVVEIYIQAPDKCYSFPFYTDYSTIQSFKVTDGICEGDLIKIGVVNG
jgi:hypothetical protein